MAGDGPGWSGMVRIRNGCDGLLFALGQSFSKFFSKFGRGRVRQKFRRNLGGYSPFDGAPTFRENFASRKRGNLENAAKAPPRQETVITHAQPREQHTNAESREGIGIKVLANTFPKEADNDGIRNTSQNNDRSETHRQYPSMRRRKVMQCRTGCCSLQEPR